jgi:hypothetical protein
MPSADATISTDRSSRYLTQLCRHLKQTSRMPHRPPPGEAVRGRPAVHQVDWSDTAGTIRFSDGTCSLRATSDTLTLHVDADDEDVLQRLQDGIARRLETIGRRDRLTVHWRRSDSASDAVRDDTAPDDPTDATASAADTIVIPRPRRVGRTLVMVGLAALAIVVHVGLFGNALAASPWASWGSNIVVAIILLKLAAVAVHVLLGRSAFRHRRRSRHRQHGHTEASGAAENSVHPHEHTS